MTLLFSRQIFEMYWGIKFSWYHSGGSRYVHGTDGWTVRQTGRGSWWSFKLLIAIIQSI